MHQAQKLRTLNALHCFAFPAEGAHLPHTCLDLVSCCYSTQLFSVHLPDCSVQSYIWLPLQSIDICRELLYQGDRDTILEVLTWIFEQDQQQPKVLQKRAHVGFYLSGLEVGAASSEAGRKPRSSRPMLGVRLHLHCHTLCCICAEQLGISLAAPPQATHSGRASLLFSMTESESRSCAGAATAISKRPKGPLQASQPSCHRLGQVCRCQHPMQLVSNISETQSAAAFTAAAAPMACPKAYCPGWPFCSGPWGCCYTRSFATQANSTVPALTTLQISPKVPCC